MHVLLKVAAYAACVVVGALIGVTLSGAFINYEMFFNGIPVGQLSAQQISAIIGKDHNAMTQTSSVIVGGTTLFAASGAWLMWLTTIAPVPILVGIARHFIGARERARSIALAQSVA